MKYLQSIVVFFLLAGCADSLHLNTKYSSSSHDNRVQFVIVHYTTASLERSITLLTHGPVSSHYLISDDASGTIYKLVDESQRAWHAGESEWMGRTWLNSSSIGIEIVNPGYKDMSTGRVWYPYFESQMQSLIILLKDISNRNGIDPKNIIGHSDIAPLRKLDPGPLFPWKRLAVEDLGVWPDIQVVTKFQKQYAAGLPSITWFQEELARLGYQTPQTGELDTATRHVIAAFQMHFRPSLFDGMPDAESAAILHALSQG
ncbi:N-acetylmuramoyl-L-alanine amidase [Candidatus Pseudomonas adelgestsugas]|nr:N-acetylmuramoyl-L-alanine amidase [Candidatus Pseudomonas adelgestsugas]